MINITGVQALLRPVRQIASRLLCTGLMLMGVGWTAIPCAQAQTINNPLSAPVSGALDPRIKVFAYSPDIVYTLNIAVGMHTHIAMGEDEELTEKPRLGETLQWRVGGNEKNIYVKSLKLGVVTSMTLVSNKRTYQFELVSTDKPSDRVQKAYFSYPDEEERIALATNRIVVRDAEKRVVDQAEAYRKKEEELAPAIDPSRLNFAYKPPMGDAEFKPSAVFDDGVFTYLRLQNSQDLPAVFAADADGKLTPINYVVKRDQLILERLSKRWVLRIGKREVTIQSAGE